MTTQEQIKKNEQEIERLAQENLRLMQEPQTEPRIGQSYRYIWFTGIQWCTDKDVWRDDTTDRSRLKSGTCFWQGTDEEQEAEAQRAILRCRYALENQWKPKQGQEVWVWYSDGSISNYKFDWNNGGMVANLNAGEYFSSREAAEKSRDEFMEAFLFVPEGVK